MGYANQQLSLIDRYLPAFQGNVLRIPRRESGWKLAPWRVLIDRVSQRVPACFRAVYEDNRLPNHRKCTVLPLPEVLAFRLFQSEISPAYSASTSSTKAVERLPVFSVEIPS